MLRGRTAVPAAVVCHVKDWRPHRIATLFGEVRVRFPPVSVCWLWSYRDWRQLTIALPVDP